MTARVPGKTRPRCGGERQRCVPADRCKLSGSTADLAHSLAAIAVTFGDIGLVEQAATASRAAQMLSELAGQLADAGM